MNVVVVTEMAMKVVMKVVIVVMVAAVVIVVEVKAVGMKELETKELLRHV